MQPMIHPISSKFTQKNRPLRSRTFQPKCFELEDRVVLSQLKVVSLKPAPEIVRLRLDTINRSLEITGTRQADQVSIGKNSKGLLTLNINGKTHSADPADRGQFDLRLFGVRSDRLQTVKFTGGSSTDTLIINTSLGRNSAQLKIQTDDILRIDSGFTTNSNLSIT